MKRVVLLALTALAVAFPAGAHAAVPCRDRIYNEWYSTGKISTTYPISCYHDALQHIPSDAQVYSNLSGDIEAALQAALAREKNPGAAPAAVGHGPQPPGGVHQTKGAQFSKSSSMADGAVAAPAGSTSASGHPPTPILVLGGIAIALAGAGLAGTGWRYVRRRGAA